MSKADDCTTPIRSRRAFLTAIAVTAAAVPIAAALPVAAPAMDFPVTSAAPSIPAGDLRLVELAQQLTAAVSESRRLSLIADRLKYAHRRSGFPEALRIRPSDAELGRTAFESTDEFWHRPCDIGKWDAIDDYEVDKEDNADGYILAVRTIKPSDELRERAEEILTAYDKWDAEHQKKPAGYKAAKRAYERAADIETGLEQQIDAIQATTIEGMIAKARCAEVYHFENGTVDFGVSVTKDLLALDTGAPAIVPADLAPLPFIRTSAIEAVERYRKADKAFDRRSLKLTEAREAAEEEHGHQPIALIHWRNYYIGGGEIERVRKEFLKFGKDDPAIIESEYRDAKRRYRSAVKAAKEWEKRAGVDDLSNSLEQARAEMSAARKGLGTVNIVSVDDAAAILKVIRANLKQFGELADWEKDALNNASKYLIQTAKVA